MLQSVILSCLALPALAVVLAYPWWLYASPVLPVLVIGLFCCSVLAPILFILGFAGFGSVEAALRDEAQSLQMCLPIN